MISFEKKDTNSDSIGEIKPRDTFNEEGSENQDELSVNNIIEEVNSPGFNEVASEEYKNETENPYKMYQDYTIGTKKYQTLKSENNILKCLSALAVICLVLTVGLFGTKLQKENTTLYQSDGNRSTIVTSVKSQGEPLTAREIYKENIDSVVAIQTEIVTRNIFNQSVKGAVAGSGFIISDTGYILTNYHVIEGATKISVTLADNSTYTAKVIGTDQTNDIAVIKLDSDKTFKAVVFGDSESIEIGEDVVAIGNPLGELTFSMTKGIVSATDRLISTDLYTGINMFQVDCSVNEGNSGGPIFNMYGEVIGVVSAKYASNTIEGLGFCIPVNDAVNIVKELIANGKVTNRGSLGIKVVDMTTSEIEKFNLVQGAYIYEIIENGAADKAGLQVGDIIVEYNGKTIANVNSLLSIKRNSLKGEEVSLKIWRNGEYLDVKLTLETEIVENEEEKNLDKNETDEYNNFQEYLEDRNSRQQKNNQDTFDYSDIDDIFRYYFGY